MNTVLRFWRDVLRTSRDRRRTAAMLRGFDDHLLDDLGIHRGMIDDYVANGYRWPARETAARPVGTASLQGCG